MILTNGEIFEARNALQRLMETKFPVRTSLALAKLNTKITEPFLEIESVRNGLVETYGEAIEQAGGMKGVIPPNDPEGRPVCPKWKEFSTEYGELLTEERELTFVVVKLPEKVMATCDKCGCIMEKPLEIEPSILQALDKFIKL